jgi:hypothetical protein
VSVSPELMTELLGLPEPDRADLAWRLLESISEISAFDTLDDDDRERLHESLRRSDDDVRAGRIRPAAQLLAELEQRRSR